MPDYTLLEGDCLESLKTLTDNSVDAVVTDPPYHLTALTPGTFGHKKNGDGTDRTHQPNYAQRGFMNQAWDGGDIAFRPELWSEVLRVLKPGGHLASFGGTRTYHRMTCAIEDAGFEVRDQLAWVYGQGFPKSLNISKAIDRSAGAEREVVGSKITGRANAPRSEGRNHVDCAGGQMVVAITAPATDAARQWEGWGTALKPAWEPICLARKPLSEKTVAANVLRWGTGAINVGATRIEANDKEPTKKSFNPEARHEGYARPWMDGKPVEVRHDGLGRFPANLCHDGSDEVLDLFPETKSGKPGDSIRNSKGFSGIGDSGLDKAIPLTGFGDSGSAARFFYCAKASKGDRAGSKHPTVKPIKLMQWLCRLITPPGGTILDPFAGSGTMGLAARLEGFRAILCEREAEYIADIRNRMDERASQLVAAE